MGFLRHSPVSVRFMIRNLLRTNFAPLSAPRLLEDTWGGQTLAITGARGNAGALFRTRRRLLPVVADDPLTGLDVEALPPWRTQVARLLTPVALFAPDIPLTVPVSAIFGNEARCGRPCTGVDSRATIARRVPFFDLRFDEWWRWPTTFFCRWA